MKKNEVQAAIEITNNDSELFCFLKLFFLISIFETQSPLTFTLSIT